jgi:hypothetical protein
MTATVGPIGGEAHALSRATAAKPAAAVLRFLNDALRDA